MSAFALAISFWPCMIPFAITIGEDRGASLKPCIHVLGAGLWSSPSCCPAVTYRVFSGKFGPMPGHDDPAKR